MTYAMNEVDARVLIALEKEAKDMGFDNREVCDYISKKMGGVKPNSIRQRLWLAHIFMNGNKKLTERPAEAAKPGPIAAPQEAVADPIDLRRAKQRAEDATRLLKSLEKRLVETEEIRGSLMGLGAPQFSELMPDTSKQGGRRSVILHVSDIQYAEYIDLESLDGVNSYSIEIANARLARYFQKAFRFITELWNGAPPEEVVLLNGDMISGALHLELDRTDQSRPMLASKQVAEQLASGISLIRSGGFPVRVIVTAGNHGRMTLKPESKGHVLQNYDTLVGWFIEAHFKPDDGVMVCYSKSVDALFNVFDFPFLVTHGDRMGSRGGQGFLGATATILRGHHKLFADYATRGFRLYKIFTAHFHTEAETPFGYANGTVAGWSEYARDGRMRPSAASQDYFVIHEDHGVIEHRHIIVGVAEEGTGNSVKLTHAGDSGALQ